jgi:hypothetical protein
MKLDIDQLESIAKDLLSKNEFYDVGDFADEYSPLIWDKVLAFTTSLIEEDGIPEHYTGYGFQTQHGEMEVLCCELESGKYYPSVSSPWWEAKISSVDVEDPELGFNTPAEALASGIVDLLCNLYGAELTEEIYD